MENKIKNNSTGQYLTFIASSGEESLEIKYENENIWLTPKMMAELYDVSVAAINQHIKTLMNDGEIDGSTIKYFLIVQKEGSRNINRNVEHYNLQAIISIGFKIENERAIAFRKWARQIIKEYTIQCWSMDAEKKI